MWLGLFLVVSIFNLFSFVYLFLKSQSYEKLKAQIEECRHQSHLIVQANINLGEHLSLIEKNFERLAEKQDEITQATSTDSNPYTQAVKMIEMGTSLDTVVAVSGLTRAQVETIQSLKRIVTRKNAYRLA